MPKDLQMTNEMSFNNQHSHISVRSHVYEHTSKLINRLFTTSRQWIKIAVFTNYEEKKVTERKKFETSDTIKVYLAHCNALQCITLFNVS